MMTFRPIAEHALTRDDIRALRKATDLTFCLADGRCTMTALERRRSMLAETYAERRIDCAARVTDYSGKRSTMGYVVQPEHMPAVHAFKSHVSAQHCPYWRTLRDIIKAGDCIGLEWGHDAGTTLALRGLGIGVDTLDVVVWRNPGTAREYLLRFRFDHQTHNATTSEFRMVRLPAY